jgi:hypothetical protein
MDCPAQCFCVPHGSHNKQRLLKQHYPIGLLRRRNVFSVAFGLDVFPMVLTLNSTDRLGSVVET